MTYFADNQQMVDKERWPEARGDVARRLLETVRACGYPSVAEFARSLRDDDGKPYADMRVRQWFVRDTVSRKSMPHVRQLTGVSPDYVWFGTGDQFPDGPIMFRTKGDSVTPGIHAEFDYLALRSVLEGLVKAVSANVQGAAEVFVADVEASANEHELDLKKGLLRSVLGIARTELQTLEAASQRVQRGAPRARTKP